MKLPPVVIVPDLRDSPRSWQRVANLVHHFTHDIVAVELTGLSIEADAARVRAALEACAEPPVVVAHGYGAVPASVAANSRNAAQLIFVAGYMLDYGETIYDVAGGPATPLSTTRIDAVGWRALPTTYVVAAGDRRLSDVVQERLAYTRATTIVSLDLGDQLQSTHAEALAQILHEDLLALRGAPLQAELDLVRTA